jgi:DNA-binding response OmpR family regulator
MSLAKARVLVVEDEYLIAVHVQDELERAGAEVIGPVPTVKAALQLLERTEIDAAVLNVTLADGPSLPVAEALQKMGKVYVFVTAYEQNVLPGAYVSVPVLNKPVNPTVLIEALAARLGPTRLDRRHT